MGLTKETSSSQHYESLEVDYRRIEPEAGIRNIGTEQCSDVRQVAKYIRNDSL